MTPKPVSNDTLLQQLQWRYATKQFDPARKVAAEDWHTLEQALVLSPSSFGLQPYHFVVVTQKATQEKLVEASWNQRQVADASHLVVFATRKSLSATDVDHYLDRMAQVRGVERQSLDGFRGVLLGFLGQPAEQFNPQHWATRQAYIALGNLLTSAALLGLDACPLEGIEPAKYDEILGLPAQGLQTVVAAAVGYRAATDKYAHLPKVRFPASELVTHIS